MEKRKGESVLSIQSVPRTWTLLFSPPVHPAGQCQWGRKQLQVVPFRHTTAPASLWTACLTTSKPPEFPGLCQGHVRVWRVMWPGLGQMAFSGPYTREWASEFSHRMEISDAGYVSTLLKALQVLGWRVQLPLPRGGERWHCLWALECLVG